MGGQLDNATEIEGATDGTAIGNVGDRLKVDAAFTQSPVPGEDVLWTSTHLKLNGTGTIEMDVNGATGQDIFSVLPGAGEVFYLHSVTILIIDPGNMLYSNFGSLGGLANGCDLRCQSKGVSHLMAHVENNMDLATEFPTDQLVLSTAAMFFTEDDVYSGSFTLPVPTILRGDDSDFIRMEINDNLVGLTFFRCRVKYFELNP